MEDIIISCGERRVHGFLARAGEGRSPLVILMHGLLDNCRTPLLSRITELLLERGISVLGFDFCGHGQSEDDINEMSVQRELDEARAVLAFSRSLDFVGDIALLGHSQGAVVASMIAGEQGEALRCEVLLSPGGVMRDSSLVGVILGARFDPKNPPEFVELQGHRLGLSYLRDAQSLPLYETAALYRGPALVIHGRRDKVVPPCYAIRYYHLLNAQLRIIEDAGHTLKACTEEAARLSADFLAENLEL